MLSQQFDYFLGFQMDRTEIPTVPPPINFVEKGGTATGRYLRQAR